MRDFSNFFSVNADLFWFHYAPNKYLVPEIKQEHTEDTANDDASVSSFSSWWTAGPGPANKADITRSSLDKIFGR